MLPSVGTAREHSQGTGNTGKIEEYSIECK
jgi:hypothetical protein